MLGREVVGPELGNSQEPQTSLSFFLHPAHHLLWYLHPPFGNSRGQDWVTYELNQHLLLSPRAPAVPSLFGPAAHASCPPVPLYIHLFLLFNFYFYFFYY